MMTMELWLFPSLLIFMGAFTFVSNRKHLLSMLMSLEFIVLSSYLLLFFFLSVFLIEMSISVMFLTFSVCEGALGLSILVSMIRTHGNDYFQSFSILEC